MLSATGEIVPAGKGDGKIDRIISKIKDDKVLTLEPHLAIFDMYKQIDGTEMKLKTKFSSSKEAFTCAVDSLKQLLFNGGYKETSEGFIK